MLGLTISEGHCTCLCDTVVDHTSASCVRSHGCNADDVSLLRLDHVWQELSHSVPMADQVDLEDLLEVSIRSLCDEVCSANACIVVEDGDCSMLFLDLVCDLLNTGGRCDIALVEEDLASCCRQSCGVPSSRTYNSRAQLVVAAHRGCRHARPS